MAVCSENEQREKKGKIVRDVVNREVRAAERPRRTDRGCEGGNSAQEVDNSQVVIVSQRKT